MTATVAPGLREQKRIATQRALRLALLELALQRGFDAVTIEEIAQAAGVSPRTFFNYFASKEEALVGAQGALVTSPAVRQRFLDATGDVLSDLVQLIAASIGDEDEPDVHRLRKQLMHRDTRLLGMQLASAHRFTETATELVVQRLRADAARAGQPAAETETADRAGLIVMVATAIGRHGWSRWVRAGGVEPLPQSILTGFADFRLVCGSLQPSESAQH